MYIDKPPIVNLYLYEMSQFEMNSQVLTLIHDILMIHGFQRGSANFVISIYKEATI